MRKRTTTIISLLCTALLLFFACSEDEPAQTSSTPQNYDVIFDGNGDNATGSMDPMTMTSQSSTNLTTNSFSRTGWVFAGWALTPEGSTIYNDAAYFTMLNKHVTLYAKWSLQITVRNIFFDKNDSAATGTTGLQVLNSGSTANLHLNGFSKTNYDFWGWAQSTNGAIVYTNGQSITMSTSNVYLFARWIPSISGGQYYVSFQKNDYGAEGRMDSQVIAQSASANLTANTFTKKGWTFSGWATNNSGPVVYSDGASFSMGSSHVNLYAKWTPPASYAIGDRCPAGGIVFYDKGSYSEGWRYMAISPFMASSTIWAVAGFPLDITSSAIGTGATNTYYITLMDLATEDSIPAACIATNHSYHNGGVLYDSWFLPSKAELGLIHTNMTAAGLGSLGGKHWSSSQYNINRAYKVDMTTGEAYDEWKEATGMIRPIWAF